MNHARASKVAIFTMLLAGLLVGWPAAADDGSGGSVVTFSEVVSPSRFDGDLRTLPKPRSWQPGDPIKEIPRIRRSPKIDAPEYIGVRDPLAAAEEAAMTADFTTLGHNFEGQGFTGVYPPDPCGDVGADYFIQAINSADGTSFMVYDKGDGSVAAGPVILDTLGTDLCADGYGDPIVLYDAWAQRWLLSEFSNTQNKLCVYISQTSDPIAGGWYNYEFTAPNFPDYPKYAVWQDGYYVGTNESYRVSGNTWVTEPSAYALERSAMLNGLPAGLQRATATPLDGFGFQMLIPADADGATPSPASEPAVFLRHRDDEGHEPGSADPTMDFVEVWEMAVDWSVPANTTFVKATDVPTAEFDSSLCGWTSYQCFPQPDTATVLDPLREIVMHRSPYRNFGTHASIVGNFVVDVDGLDTGGLRWFELQKAPGGGWTLAQEGTYSPDALNRWTGAISMDNSGNIALAFNVSDATTYPGIRFTGRLFGDPIGTMTQTELTLVDGVNHSPANRWGDYASMTVDPVDDSTFWITSEYGTGASWGTWISSVSFEPSDTLFADGFESSDTSAWTSAVP